MNIIKVLEPDDIIEKDDWVKATNETDWAPVSERIPYWIGKKLGSLNTSITTHAVIRCKKLPFAFPKGKWDFKGVTWEE